MGLADTANLVVRLSLEGNFGSALAAGEKQLAGFNATASRGVVTSGLASGAFSKLGIVATGVGGALSHAGGQLKNLITGPLGMIGLAGGLLSVGGALSSTLSKLNDLAFGTEKLSAITGDSAASLSTLIASTEKYGITVDKLSVIAGFYEKTAGKLNEATAKGAAATKSAELQNLELVKAQRVAAGESTKRIDILIKEQKARDLITAAAAGAADSISKLVALDKQYGVVLVDNTGKAVSFNEALLTVADYYAKSTDKAQAAALAATLFGRSWQTLAPILVLGKQGILDLETEAAKMGLQLSESNVADFAKYRAGLRASQEAIAGLQVAIGEELLPTITDLANGVSVFVKEHKADIVGFVRSAVDVAKTATSVIGDLVGKVAGWWNTIPPEVRDILVRGFIADKTVKFLFGFDPAKMLLGGLGGGLLSRGSSPANPMYVSGGGLGSTGVVGGLLDVVQKVFLVGILASVADDIQAALGTNYDPSKNLPLDQLSWPFGPKNTPHVDLGPFKNVFGGDSNFTPPPDTHIPGGAGGGFDSSLIGRNPDHPLNLGPSNIDPTADAREANRILRVTGQVEASGLSRIAQAILRFGYTPAQWAAIYARAAEAGGRSQINALARTHKALDAIALADSETSKFLTGTAGPFFRDGKNQTRLLASLEKDQAYFRAHGDTVTAARLGADIAALKNKPNIVNVTVPVNMYVTIRDYVRQQTIASHYGTVFGGRVVNRTYS